MNPQLESDLADNAKQWLALSQSISTSEKATFDALHNGFFAAYGPNFMAHVYRASIEQVLQNMPTVERDKLLVAFRQALDEAIAKHAYMLPTAADCSACHARKF
jgi:hypothetical protein